MTSQWSSLTFSQTSCMSLIKPENMTSVHSLLSLPPSHMPIILAAQFPCIIESVVFNTCDSNSVEVPPLSAEKEIYSVLLLIFPGVSKLSLSSSSSTNCIITSFNQ